MKNLSRLLTTLLLYTYTPAVWAGSTTLVTYYPAPSGHYDTLQLTAGMDEKRACSAAGSDGTVFIDSNGDIQVCKGQKSSATSSWKLIESPSAPGIKYLSTPSTVNNIYFGNKVGIAAAPSTTGSVDALTVGGGIKITESDKNSLVVDPGIEDPASMQLSSRIVFYINQLPELYVGVTQNSDSSILSFFGPKENAEDSFIAVDNTSGNVGIGNKIPTEKFDVTGSIKASDKILAENQIITGGGLFLSTQPVDSTTTGDPSITRGSDASLVLTGGGAGNLVKINSSLNVAGDTALTGNVGIGLTSAQDENATLEVNGKIYATTPDENDGPNAVVTKGYLSENTSACFNRFCDYTTPAETSCSVTCPTELGFEQVAGVVDDFVTDHFSTSSVTHVISIACCKQ